MEKQFQKKSATKVAQKAAAHTSNGLSLEDNRPSTVIQQKKNNTGLPDSLKSGIENLSGHSLDDVKVHYNSAKPAQLNAHAYAQGTNIHLASGQEKHLPHEAWHIVQQKQGRVRPTKTVNGAKINDNAGLEKEADVMGAKALQRKVISNETTQLQEIAQLGKKSRKEAATKRNQEKREKKKKEEQNKKNQEHTKNARKSTQDKHQKGQAAKKLSVEDSAFRAYKQRGGRLSKQAWKRAGMPAR